MKNIKYLTEDSLKCKADPENGKLGGTFWDESFTEIMENQNIHSLKSRVRDFCRYKVGEMDIEVSEIKNEFLRSETLFFSRNFSI